MQIDKRLQQHRKKHNMSQEDLAEQLHISRQSVSKWENGTSLPSFANVVAISELFDISLDELIKGDENLMKELENGPKMNKAGFVVVTGISLSIIAYIFLTAVFHLPEDNLYNWITIPIIVSFVGLVLSIKWRNIDKVISKWTVTLAIIWITLMMIPNIYDIVAGFLDGSNHR